MHVWESTVSANKQAHIDIQQVPQTINYISERILWQKPTPNLQINDKFVQLC